MDASGFRKAASVLSREHGLSVLRCLSSGEWRIASELSRTLRVHTSTVSNLLAPMYELGILQRRVRTSHTRSTFEYRMPSTRVALEVDFRSPPDLLPEAIAYCVACIASVFAKVERLGVPGVVERMEACLGTTREKMGEALSARLRGQGAGHVRTAFEEVYQELLAIAAESIGRGAANRVFDTAASEARQGREAIVDRFNLRSRTGGSV